jgi:hypothetical protein
VVRNQPLFFSKLILGYIYFPQKKIPKWKIFFKHILTTQSAIGYVNSAYWRRVDCPTTSSKVKRNLQTVNDLGFELVCWSQIERKKLVLFC